MNVDFRVIDQAIRAEMIAMDREVDRATMWGLREVGRRLKSEAKKLAPVYRGKTSVGRKSAKADYHSGASNGVSGPPVRGMLRASIGSSRRLKHLGPGGYGLVVGPRGLRPHLYAQKVEKQAHYMGGGFDAIRGEITAIHAVGWQRAMRKAGRI